ncbi:MAG TPA: lysine--tRNA ligase [Nitrososphaerales archaeon]|nr:lysine--tRNA ligase [Nitrososphaerales archaeon]
MSSQEAGVIGRGTWLDRVAHELLERENALGRDTSLLRVESGLGASGIPHIGSVGDAIRSYGVKLALETAGYKSELIAYSDDLDGLRKVPAGFPPSLKEYIAHPVTRIPDPFGCHPSFGAHTGGLLRSALDDLGIPYKFMSGAEVYKKGLLNEQIKKILDNAKTVGRAIKDITGQDKYLEVIPYTPICQNCGRLYTTVVTSYDPASGIVRYKCDIAEIGNAMVKGCGHVGERKVTEGEGKLVWKSEFAARWAALGIRFEAYGKDIADSVKVNDWISEHVLGYPPPYHARYEMFQDKSGRKVSKSVGNVITIQDWLNYASPESVRLLMFKRIVGARNISVDDVPVYMDEFDELEDSYFAKKRDQNAMKDAKLRGLYEYTMLLQVPQKPSLHVPYRLLAELASTAPEGALEEYVSKRLVAYGLIKDSPSEALLTRIRWAAAWSKREGTVTQAAELPELSVKQKKALQDFAAQLSKAATADEIQGAAFAAMRGNGLQAGEFFPLVYAILLGSQKGPRLGAYVVDAGPKTVAEKLARAVSSSRKHN